MVKQTSTPRKQRKFARNTNYNVTFVSTYVMGRNSGGVSGSGAGGSKVNKGATEKGYTAKNGQEYCWDRAEV